MNGDKVSASVRIARDVMPPTKDEEAKELAKKHYQVEGGLTHVIRIGGIAEVEFRPNEPIKLL